MPERRKLSDKEIAAGIATLKGWSVQGGKLQKEFTFKDFVGAFGFMASVALIAEGLNHHPDWSNLYNSVVIGLSTHTEGGITGYDLEFARKVEALQS